MLTSAKLPPSAYVLYKDHGARGRFLLRRALASKLSTTHKTEKALHFDSARAAYDFAAKNPALALWRVMKQQIDG